MTLALLVFCAALFVNMLLMMRTQAAHQRHLAALDETIRALKRHLAAHDGGLALLRQEARAPTRASRVDGERVVAGRLYSLGTDRAVALADEIERGRERRAPEETP